MFHLIRRGNKNGPTRCDRRHLLWPEARKKTSREWIVDRGRNLPVGTEYPSLRTWKGIIQPRLSIDGSPYSVTRRSKFAMRRVSTCIYGISFVESWYTRGVYWCLCTPYEINQLGLNLVTISYRINIRRWWWSTERRLYTNVMYCACDPNKSILGTLDQICTIVYS